MEQYSNNNGRFKELSTFQSILMLLGAVMMVVGMGLYVFLIVQLIAAMVFLVGALVFSTLQCMQVYRGTDFTIRRLKAIQNLSDLCFVLAGILMIDSQNHFLMPMFSNVETYIDILQNKWLILLLVAVVLEVYTTHRISHILNKENRK